MKKACFLITAMFLLASTPLDGVPHLLNYQGKLTNNATGDPLSGTFSMTFCLYDAETGGTPLWCETNGTVEVGHIGVFNVLIGAVDPTGNPLPASQFDGQDLWLGVTVESESEMIPRQRIVSVGYALTAETAGDGDTVDGYHAGHSNGEVPISDGTVNTDLNADMLDGYHVGDIPNLVSFPVYDYNTSASSYTVRSSADLKICYGVITVTGSQTITGLPFTSADSYRVITVQNGTSDNFPASVVNNSGSQFTLYKTNSHSYHWIAIGT